MRKQLMITLVVLVGASALYAYGSPRFRPLDTSQILGFTDAQVTGATFGLVEACQSQFPDSHVCTPADLVLTNVVPEGSNAGEWAWIEGTTLQSEGSSLVCSLGLHPNSVGFAGAAIDMNGNFGALDCEASYPVACCK